MHGIVSRCKAEWHSERDVRSLVCGSCEVAYVSMPGLKAHSNHAIQGGRVCTWCMISLRTSMGKSSNLSGPFAAFSFPFGAVLTASSAGGALTIVAGTPVFHTASGSCGVAMVAMVCASSGDCESGWPASCSEEGCGEAVLGEPGDVESGEEAMLLCEVTRTGRRDAPSPNGGAKRGTA